MSDHTPGPMQDLRHLAGELEDMSVWKDKVSIFEVRTRLEPAIYEAERCLGIAIELLREMAPVDARAREALKQMGVNDE